MLLQRSLFKKCGRNFYFGHGCEFSYDNIEIGNDVYIGPGSNIIAAISTIRIGNKVMFGPNVTILAGDHRTDIVGSYMKDVVEKLPENDLDVTIEEDVWIGANTVILKGVTIGKGSVVGASSVVLKDIPPYSIYVGNPGIKIRSRWDSITIARHEEMLKRDE